MSSHLTAGASTIDISPVDSQFLFGYPHVERYSTGVHDPLFSSALYLCNGNSGVIFIANDIVFIPREVVNNARARIERETNVPAGNIMITATHTHSAPHTVDHISNQSDPMVPKADKKYVQFMEDSIVQAAVNAFNAAVPAKVGLAIADDTGVGTNRRDPEGPADHQVPVLMVRSLDDKNIACMLICSMHPTVLHEDSMLVSGDFPGLSRIYLQKNVLGEDCVIVHHTGPSGNQSPRHVTKANTFAEAERLGAILATAVEKVIPEIEYHSSLDLDARQKFTDLPRKSFPAVADAQASLDKAIETMDRLANSNAPSQDVRTAECDIFGAEETLTLAKASQSGDIEKACQARMPAEIQVIKVGPWSFAAWSAEVFIEYSLAVKKEQKDSFIISVANGELQGYIVTEQAAELGGYEASNGLFSYQSGQILVDKTIELLSELK